MRTPRRNFLVGMSAGLAVAVAATAEQQKPNIIFIMADDHTTQAVGAYGSRLASLNPTPNLDALAKNGMRFDRVFCTNSICTPSRVASVFPVGTDRPSEARRVRVAFRVSTRSRDCRGQFGSRGERAADGSASHPYQRCPAACRGELHLENALLRNNLAVCSQ